MARLVAVRCAEIAAGGVLRIPPGQFCSPTKPLAIAFQPGAGASRCGTWLFADADADDWLELIPEKHDGYWLDLPGTSDITSTV